MPEDQAPKQEAAPEKKEAAPKKKAPEAVDANKRKNHKDYVEKERKAGGIMRPAK